MTDSDERIVDQAMQILSNNLRHCGHVMESPGTTKRFLTLRLARQEREIFGALFLNVKNQLAGVDDLFLGTLTHTSVYPREVVRQALIHNAASVICYHNHPSGNPTPSGADKQLTAVLQDALQLLEVRLLDHIIVAGMDTYSFAEHGDL